MGSPLEFVVDASIVLAAILNEPEKATILEKTRGRHPQSPGCLRWEIGNALSAMLKRKRLSRVECDGALAAFSKIPIKEVEVNLSKALELCENHNLYAYDAYYLEVARQHSRPLMSLDRRMIEAAENEGIGVERI